jgi:hypothetical protein
MTKLFVFGLTAFAIIGSACAISQEEADKRCNLGRSGYKAEIVPGKDIKCHKITEDVDCFPDVWNPNKGPNGEWECWYGSTPWETVTLLISINSPSGTKSQADDGTGVTGKSPPNTLNRQRKF